MVTRLAEANRRAVVSVAALLGSAVALAAGCGGDAGDATIPCEMQSHCTPHGLVCDTNIGVCVAGSGGSGGSTGKGGSGGKGSGGSNTGGNGRGGSTADGGTNGSGGSATGGGGAGCSTGGSGGSAGAATGGAGMSGGSTGGSGGGSGGSTGGSAGGGQIFACDGDAVSPTSCDPSAHEPGSCNECIETNCCPQWQQCAANDLTSGDFVCGWGGPNGTGEIGCIVACMQDGTSTLQDCVMGCASPECPDDGIITVATSELIGCMTTAETSCEEACWPTQ